MLICVLFFGTPWTSACQAYLSFTIFQSLLKLMFVELMMPSNNLILCSPLLLLPSIFPNMRSFPMSQLFTSGAQSIGASASASVLAMNQSFRTDFLQNGLVGSPCCPRDSQESSPTPQFESINSSALSFLCSPTLTSIHDYWKKP